MRGSGLTSHFCPMIYSMHIFGLRTEYANDGICKLYAERDDLYEEFKLLRQFK